MKEALSVGSLFDFEMDSAMSAFGPKRTWPSALHMSAFGGKADMMFCTAYVCF